MTRSRLASVLASVGAGLNFLISGLHFSRTSFVVSQAPTADLQALLAALWVAVGLMGLVAALLAVAATPLFVVRRRAFLWIAAAIPVSIAICQIAYLGFLVPTAILLVNGLVLIVSAELGRTLQPAPQPVAVT